MTRRRSLRPETFAFALTLGLLAASCTAILGIDNVYREGSIFSSGTGGGGGSTASSSAGSGGGTTSSSASASSAAGGAPLAVWQSWDVQTSGTPEALSVFDTNGKLQATIIPYESQSLTDLGVSTALTIFNPGQHPDGLSHVGDFWTPPLASAFYPYVGKSSVPRGMDNGEQNATPPIGVSDLQLFPSSVDKLVVASFVVPLDADYTISGLSARRVSGNGNNAALRVFVDNTEVGPISLLATGNRAWVNDGMAYPLGHLQSSTRINFAVDAVGDVKADATEIAWTITAQ